MDQNGITETASRLLEIICTTLFNDCYPLSREFRELPNRAGIYVIQHCVQGILYSGKSGNVRARLRGGHKALGWAFTDRLDPDDVRIVVARLSFSWSWLSLQLEQILLRQTRSPYNPLSTVVPAHTGCLRVFKSGTRCCKDCDELAR